MIIMPGVPIVSHRIEWWLDEYGVLDRKATCVSHDCIPNIANPKNENLSNKYSSQWLLLLVAAAAAAGGTTATVAATEHL